MDVCSLVCYKAILPKMKGFPLLYGIQKTVPMPMKKAGSIKITGTGKTVSAESAEWKVQLSENLELEYLPDDASPVLNSLK